MNLRQHRAPDAPHDLPRGVTLDDGTRVRLRLGTPDDRDALVAGFERLSLESRANRFFTGMQVLPDRIIDRLLDVDECRHVAIVAEDATTSSPDWPENGIGVGRYITATDDPTRAEIAITVIDEFHGRGIGRLLLETLIERAADAGISTLDGSILSVNTVMTGLVTSLGGTVRSDPDDRTMTQFELPIATADERSSPDEQ